MSTLTRNLNRIFEWLQRNCPSYADSLQDGLSYRYIQEITKILPFQLPPEIYELYQWRNGSQEELKGAWDIIHIPEFLTLEKAVEVGVWYATDPDQGGQRYRDHMIFPFLGDGNLCCAVVIGDKNQVVETYSEGDPPCIIYTSIASTILTIADFCESGIYSIDAEGFLRDQNIEEASKILRRNNFDVLETAFSKVMDLVSNSGEPPEYRNDLSYYESLRIVEMYRDTRVIEPFLDLLNAPKPPEIITQVIATLGEFNDIRAVQSLINLLQSPNIGIKYAAVKALGKLGDTRAIEPLTQMIIIVQESTNILENAVTSLGKLNACDALLQCLGHEIPELRRLAAIYLGDINCTDAIAPLFQLALQENDRNVKISIVTSLRELRAIECLSQLSESLDSFLSRLAQFALDYLVKH